MISSFPRILTLLRKERGISQKAAANALGVSQALLSHYEKGIRECGLDFVVRAADFYQVSCDYLLGRTADKSGAMIAVEEIPETDPTDKESHFRGSVLPILNKKLTINSVNIIFDLLRRADNKALTNEVSAYFTLAIYTLFRELYCANPHNPEALFSVPEYLFHPSVLGEMSRSISRISELAAGHSVGGDNGLTVDNLITIVPDSLSNDYPLFASSLFNLLRNAEMRLGKMK